MSPQLLWSFSMRQEMTGLKTEDTSTTRLRFCELYFVLTSQGKSKNALNVFAHIQLTFKKSRQRSQMKHFSVFPYSFLGTCSQHSSGLVKISLSLSCKQPVSNTKVAKSLLSVQRSFHSRLRVSKFLARYFILSLTHHLNPAQPRMSQLPILCRQL